MKIIFNFVYIYSNPCLILHNYFTTISLFTRLRNCSIGIQYCNLFSAEKNNVFNIVLVAPILSSKDFSALKYCYLYFFHFIPWYVLCTWLNFFCYVSFLFLLIFFLRGIFKKFQPSSVLSKLEFSFACFISKEYMTV